LDGEFPRPELDAMVAQLRGAGISVEFDRNAIPTVASPGWMIPNNPVELSGPGVAIPRQLPLR